MNVSGESHSAENHKESPMLAKRFVSIKNRGGFDRNKLEKVAMKKRQS